MAQSVIKNLVKPVLLSGAVLSLGACTYGGLGIGTGYSGGYVNGYSSYDCDPYAPFNDYYACDNGYGFVNIGFGGGWYDHFYYPGYGYYIFDRGGHRHHMKKHHRRYWAHRRAEYGVRQARRGHRHKDGTRHARRGQDLSPEERAERRDRRAARRAERRAARGNVTRGQRRNGNGRQAAVVPIGNNGAAPRRNRGADVGANRTRNMNRATRRQGRPRMSVQNTNRQARNAAPARVSRPPAQVARPPAPVRSQSRESVGRRMSDD